MRKINKTNVTMHTQGERAFITEQIKNDVNGNPRFNLMVFEQGYCIESYNIQAYNSEMAIDKYLERVGK